jgi:hypothetical protein
MTTTTTTTTTATHDDVLAIASEITAHPGNESARQGRFARMYPSFVEAYPKLFEMCCSAQDPAVAATVLQVLPFMLQRLQAIGKDGTTTESASQEVVADLSSRYIEPVLPPVPPQT